MSFCKMVMGFPYRFICLRIGFIYRAYHTSAQSSLHIAQVAVVHHDDIIVILQCVGWYFAAAEIARFNRQAVQNFRSAAVHVFAVVPARSARTGHVHGNAALLRHVAQDVFSHGRAADVAQADEQDFFHHRTLVVEKWDCMPFSKQPAYFLVQAAFCDTIALSKPIQSN